MILYCQRPALLHDTIEDTDTSVEELVGAWVEILPPFDALPFNGEKRVQEQVSGIESLIARMSAGSKAAA